MAMGAVPITSAPSKQGVRNHVNLSTPAGWAFLYWILAVGIIGFMFFTV